QRGLELVLRRLRSLAALLRPRCRGRAELLVDRFERGLDLVLVDPQLRGEIGREAVAVGAVVALRLRGGVRGALAVASAALLAGCERTRGREPRYVKCQIV